MPKIQGCADLWKTSVFHAWNVSVLAKTALPRSMRVVKSNRMVGTRDARRFRSVFYVRGLENELLVLSKGVSVSEHVPEAEQLVLVWPM